MSASLSIANILSRRVAQPARGLDPELLLAEGILGDVRKPEHALRRAAAMADRGHYKEARTILLPHARTCPEDMRGPVGEELAICALHTGAGDFDAHIEMAYAAYEGARDLAGLARVQRLRGDNLARRGELHGADAMYDEAAQTFAHLGDATRLAVVEGRRARLRRITGDLHSARSRLESALDILSGAPQPRAEGFLRLERAAVLAALGDGPGAAKDLIAAERLLGTGSHGVDGIKTRLVRAETLLLFGETERAVAGLRRLVGDTARGDDSVLYGHVERLLGEALAAAAPSEARGHLMRARHIYEEAGAAFFAARCDIELAHVERRVGLNPQGRIKAVSQGRLAEWGLLAHELRALRAVGIAKNDPEKARGMIIAVLAAADAQGSLRLAARMHNLLREVGLVSGDAAAMEAEDTVADAPIVASGTASLEPAPTAHATPRFELYEDDDEGAGVSLNPRLPVAARVISPTLSATRPLRLLEPRSTGVLPRQSGRIIR